MKKITIILLTVALLIGVFFAAIYALSSHIYLRQDCEQFNIDNIEMRAKIDIPAVLDVNCRMDEATNIKYSEFTINQQRVNLEDYIVKHQFKSQGELYTRKGSQEDTDWEMTLDKNSGKMSIKITYKS